MSASAERVVVPLIAAVTDPHLLGATLDWRPRQLDVLRLFGDDSLRVVVVAAGRQGGKSSAAVATAIWCATCRPDLDMLMPRGRTRFVLVACPAESQSREAIRLAAGMIEASPILRDLATVTADRITFALPSGARTAIQALPANPRSVRGMTASMVICDEAAHFSSLDAGIANDARMLEALEGSMSVFDAYAKSKLILISTPAAEVGRFFELFCAARDGLLPNAAALQAPAWELNPALDSEEWRESKRRLLGVDAFNAEHGAEFTSGSGQLFDLRGIDLDDAPARPEDGRSWVAGLDPAFSNDRFGVALVGPSVAEPGLLLVGRVEALGPGQRLLSFERRRAREDRTLEKVWEIIAPYAPRIVTDQHQGDAVSSFFGRLGCGVRVVNLTGPTQTAAFMSTRTRLLDGSLRLWRCPPLLEDLRRIRATDAESVALPRYSGGHCDAAAALALAVFEFRGVTGAPPGELRVGYGSVADSDKFAVLDGRRPGQPRRDPDAPRGSPIPPPGWGRRTSVRDMQF